jgi:hypothetical protein
MLIKATWVSGVFFSELFVKIIYAPVTYFLFVYCFLLIVTIVVSVLCNASPNSPDYIVSNDTTINENEWERAWKEAVVA